MNACTKPTKKYPNGRTGTEAGHRAHMTAKEETCTPCRDAHALRVKAERIKRSPWMWPYTMNLACEERSMKYPKGKTGTTAGYNTHVRLGDQPCQICEEAHLEARRRYAKERYELDLPKKLERNKRRKEIKRNKILTELGGDTPICHLCLSGIDLTIKDRSHPGFCHIEHVIPLSDKDGPGDVPENRKLAHLRCNLKKWNKKIEDLKLPFTPPEGAIDNG